MGTSFVPNLKNWYLSKTISFLKCPLVPTFLLLIKARRCDQKNGNVFSQGPIRLGVFCHIFFPCLSIWLRVCNIRTQQIITIVLKTILKISRHAENHVKHFKEWWNIVFKMHYEFQHVLKFSFQHALQISEHYEISRHAENHVKCFKECWTIVFKMPNINIFNTPWNFNIAFNMRYSFQHMLFQHSFLHIL